MREKLKFIYKKFNQIILHLLPFIIGALLFLIFKSPLFFVIGTGATLFKFGSSLSALKEKQGTIKSDLMEDNLEDTFEQDDEEKVGDIQIKKESYVTADQLEAILTKDAYEGLGPFEEPRVFKNNLRLLSNSKKENSEYTKDQIIDRLYKEIEMFYKCSEYLPRFEITDSAMDAFFYGLYYAFEIKGIKNRYYKEISSLVKKVISQAGEKEVDDIRITDFLEYISLLSGADFNEEEIVSISEQIRTQINKTENNVIKFSLKRDKNLENKKS